MLQVDLLQLPYPMPLIGLVNFVAGFVAEVAVLYLQIPRAWRRNPAFFRTLLWLVATQLFLIVVFLLYFLLGFGFYIIPADYQWTLALVIPLGNAYLVQFIIHEQFIPTLNPTHAHNLRVYLPSGHILHQRAVRPR